MSGSKDKEDHPSPTQRGGEVLRWERVGARGRGRESVTVKHARYFERVYEIPSRG